MRSQANNLDHQHQHHKNQYVLCGRSSTKITKQLWENPAQCIYFYLRTLDSQQCYFHQYKKTVLKLNLFLLFKMLRSFSSIASVCVPQKYVFSNYYRSFRTDGCNVILCALKRSQYSPSFDLCNKNRVFKHIQKASSFTNTGRTTAPPFMACLNTQSNVTYVGSIFVYFGARLLKTKNIHDSTATFLD